MDARARWAALESAMLRRRWRHDAQQIRAASFAQAMREAHLGSYLWRDILASSGWTHE